MSIVWDWFYGILASLGKSLRLLFSFAFGRDLNRQAQALSLHSFIRQLQL